MSSLQVLRDFERARKHFKKVRRRRLKRTYYPRESDIRAVANYLPDGRTAAPTGDKRQILLEFGRGILVILGEEGNYTTKMVSENFPYPFEMRK